MQITITGQVQILRKVGKKPYGKGFVDIVEARCYCGKKFITNVYSLKYGKKKSCGCLRRETMAETGRKNKKHGLGINKTPTYHSWRAMRERCFNSESKDYSRYGGRGITICERWGEYLNFLEDMGERPRNTTIDRIDNNGNYEPGNCRWATPKEQSNNTRTVRMLTDGEVVMNLSEWSRQLGVTRRAIYKQIKQGKLRDENYHLWSMS